MASAYEDIGLRHTAHVSAKPRNPRICMPTSRNFTGKAFQCGHYEAQDVLRDVEEVDVISLEPTCAFRFMEKWQQRLLFRDFSKRLIYMNPGLHKVRLTQEYDLFIAICQTYWDFLYISAIDGWKDCCKTSVCWIDELWIAQLPQHKHWLHALRHFDHIFVGFSGTVGPLSRAIDRQCRWLPGGVDTLRFTPYPGPPARVIDVYSIGRRCEDIHQTLLQAAARRDIFYVYDTFPRLAERDVYAHEEHRDLYANLAKRSRYFMVAPAKVNVPEESQGQVEIGYRSYEGAAAGAVMIGQPPDSEKFREMFNWPDAVIRIQPDGSDVIDVVAALGSEQERVSAISRRNAAEALLRHDWVYRWKEILRVAGLEPSAAMLAREQRLRSLAELAMHSDEHRPIGNLAR